MTVFVMPSGVNFRHLAAIGLDRPTIYALDGAVRTAKSIADGDLPNQSAEEVKTAYESNADTNAFTDAEKLKLGSVEDNASADQTGAEIKFLYESEPDTNAFTDAYAAKLSNIEANATADQTDAEILAAWQSEAAIDPATIALTNGSRPFTGAVRLASYDVAGAPVGAAGDVIYVTDGDSGSPCLAVHNGTDWLRVSLGAAISDV